MKTEWLLYSLSMIVAAVAAYLVARRQYRADASVADQLRSLLRERDANAITVEQFTSRSSALHARLLHQAPTSIWQRNLWLLPMIAAALIVGVAEFSGHGTPDEKTVGATAVARGGEDIQNIGTLLDSKLSGRNPANADAVATVPAAGGATPAGDLREMTQRLAGKLAKNPKDGSGWSLLAQSYRELQQFREADSAYAKAAELIPLSADMLADWADVHVNASDRKWDGKARDLVRRALQADARHLKALALAGSEAHSNGNYKQAIDYWTRMRSAAAPGSIEAKEAESGINEARARMAAKN